MMADIQEWFVEHQVRNFYSVSISGYHIAEAGANPISQLAFTLANGFTYVEAYLARGMDVDDFAPNLSFFFSNGMDPEYTVLGRVARRIWAVAMRDRYGADERQPEAQVPRADVGPVAARPGDGVQRHPHHAAGAHRHLRQLQQPAHQRLRRGGHHADAPSRCAGRWPSSWSSTRSGAWPTNENPNQGVVHRRASSPTWSRRPCSPSSTGIAERGGVLGAMETGYQRGRIQDESMLYEQRKHDGSLPIVGVNTFLAPDAAEGDDADEAGRSSWPGRPTTRSSASSSRLRRLPEPPRRRAARPMLDRLRDAALAGDNLFAVLMDAVRVLLARRDHRRPLRGRRPLPPQRLTPRRHGRQAATAGTRRNPEVRRPPPDMIGA